jgi:hypothetical protein
LCILTQYAAPRGGHDQDDAEDQRHDARGATDLASFNGIRTTAIVLWRPQGMV